MRFRFLSLAVGLPVLAAACSDGTGPGADPAPASLVVSPSPAAVNVGRGDTIHVRFSVAVDSASCAARFLLHRGDANGSMVPGQMRFADGYRHMMFIPDSMMAPQQRFFVHMRDGMMTRGGMPGNMGGGMGGGPHTMLMTPPTGAMRMGDGGVGWGFSTGS